MGRLAPWLGVFLLAMAACGPATPRALPADDLLLLELGGAHDSLRETLIELGALREPAPEPTPQTPVVSPDPELPTPGVGADPQPEIVRRVITVTLERGQTISELAQKHLGSAQRWTEIAELNGWVEGDLRKLQAGTAVKIEVGGQ